jgi:hypothetical protein
MAMMSVEEKEQKAKLRPTLLIGIGGTGQKVLVQLKARFLRNYGMVPSAIEFLCFDTDTTADQAQLNGQPVSLTPSTELINIGGIKISEILRNLQINPAIAAWIMEDKDSLKEKMNVQAIVAGAKAVRPLGRLAVFWNINTISSKIGSAVDRLTHMKQRSDNTGINVFIVSSVCGGTGSGSILDIAYLTRRVIQMKNINPEFCYINGIFALPSVFPTVEQTGIQANAYATLRELDYFIEKGEWHCDYGSSASISKVDYVGQRPFTICYLVDARNERGRGLSGMEEIAPMIADAVYLQIGSQVGTANNSVFDNVDKLAQSTQDSAEGKMKVTAYSSLGTASLIFPTQRIIERCAQQMGRDLITDRLLRASPDPKKTEANVNAFLQAQQLEQAQILQQVSRDAQGRLQKTVLTPSMLDQYKEAELFSATQAYLNRAENTLDNDYSQVMDLNRRTLGEKLVAAIATEADRLVDDPANGLKATIAFLDKLSERLSAIRRDLDKARIEREQARDKAQGQLKLTQDGFTAAFRAFPVGRSAKVKDARNRHVEMYQNYLTARFEARKCEVAASLLASLSSTLQTRRIALQGIVNRLQFVNNQYEAYLKQYQEGAGSSESILAQDITTEADVKGYYTEHVARLGDQIEAGLMETSNAGPVHTWLEWDQDTLSSRILTYTRGVFADLDQNTVENVILEKQGEVEPRKRLQDLINISVPFWSFQVEGRLSEGWSPDQIVVVGVNDSERSVYKDAAEIGRRLVSTFDPHVITVMQTKHGLPLFALTQYPDYREKHDLVLQRNLKPLYVFPEVRPGGERARRVFGLGVAYGFIYKSGIYYYVLPEDPVMPPTQLDKGMVEALRIFRNNNELLDRVERQVDKEISGGGTELAAKKLSEFVAAPYVKELKGSAPKTNIDRETMSVDTSVSRPNAANFEMIIGLRDLIKSFIEKDLRG